ncbi:hypothetical protein IFM89_012876 [Coptis chinensis]|uniref:Uncharacterized protein n=1 Tax=Coptis chinensis TaxID=261450 RepID=A0A835LLA2_9MAGN|nr:hypothetical protein IFM89_012876 [Coptis chinensis]
MATQKILNFELKAQTGILVRLNQIDDILLSLFGCPVVHWSSNEIFIEGLGIDHHSHQDGGAKVRTYAPLCTLIQMGNLAQYDDPCITGACIPSFVVQLSYPNDIVKLKVVSEKNIPYKKFDFKYFNFHCADRSHLKRKLDLEFLPPE